MIGVSNKVKLPPGAHDDSIVFTCPICHKPFLQADTADFVLDKFIEKEEVAALVLRGAEKVSTVRCDECRSSDIANDIDDAIIKRITEMVKEKEKSRGKKVKRVH